MYAASLHGRGNLFGTIFQSLVKLFDTGLRLSILLKPHSEYTNGIVRLL